MKKLMMNVVLFVSLGLASMLAAAATPVYVDSDWLAKNKSNPDLVLIDMSEAMQYQRFHIPGAVHMPYNALLTMRKKDRIAVPRAKAELAQVLGHFGISADSYVVIYDDTGGINAARLYWELERLGHKKMSVLDGGLVRWVLEGHKVVNPPFQNKPVVYVLPATGRDNLATLRDVRAASAAGLMLVDVRSGEEYLGDAKRKRGGHIPGARWLEWSHALDVPRGFVQKAAARLSGEIAGLGLKSKSTPIIVYCQSGHRAARAYLTLRSLGYTRVKVYAASMNEYGRYHAKTLKLGEKP